jgi:hypothetical protein
MCVHVREKQRAIALGEVPLVACIEVLILCVCVVVGWSEDVHALHVRYRLWEGVWK